MIEVGVHVLLVISKEMGVGERGPVIPSVSSLVRGRRERCCLVCEGVGLGLMGLPLSASLAASSVDAS